MNFFELLALASQIAGIVAALSDDDDAEVSVNLQFKAGRKRYTLAGALTEVTKPKKVKPPVDEEPEGEGQTLPPPGTP
jgi:hypothetical protein